MNVCKLFVRAVLCGVLPLCLLGGSLSVAAYTGSAPQEKTAGSNLRVMSYNVLVDNDESLGGWSWGQPLGTRGDKASACIEYYQPDVIGFQECNYKWHVSLKENLPDYAFVNADVPETMPLEKTASLGQKDWMCTTMMYNQKTLKLIANELIGYSVNYWGCIQRMRYVSMALFEIRATGEQFVFISTHLDAEKDAKGQANRLTQTTELVEAINRYKATYGCPVIVTGDFNSSYSDDPIQNVVQKAGMTASAENRGGIDYILYSAGVVSNYFTVVGDADVLGASDHKPVFADVQVQKYTFPTTEKTTTTTTVTTTTTTTTQGSAVIVSKSTSATAATQAAASTTKSSGTVVTKSSAVTSGTKGKGTASTDTAAAATRTSALAGDGATVSAPAGAEETATTSAPITTAQSAETQEAEPVSPDAAESTSSTADAAQEERAEETRMGSASSGIPLWIPIVSVAGGVLLVAGVGLALYFLLNKKK